MLHNLKIMRTLNNYSKIFCFRKTAEKAWFPRKNIEKGSKIYRSIKISFRFYSVVKQ